MFLYLDHSLHCGYFGPDNFLFRVVYMGGGAALTMVGCLALSMVSTHQVAPPPALTVKAKMFPHIASAPTEEALTECCFVPFKIDMVSHHVYITIT